jgi:ADP-ribosylglycohydrolase
MLDTKSPRTSVYLARSFVQAFRRDPRQGYSQGFYDLLKTFKNGTEFVQKIRPTSKKNGGAMRSIPCGLLPTPEAVMDRAMWQASLTHATRDGMNAAAAAALLAWGCRQGCDPSYLPLLLNDWLPTYHWEQPHSGPVSTDGIETVRAALEVLVQVNSLSGVLRESVHFTGDVDTVAAIAMGAASLSPHYRPDVPRAIEYGLEGGTYGKDYLRALDAKLLQAFPLPNSQPVYTGE